MFNLSIFYINHIGYAERSTAANLYAAEVTGQNGKLIVACGGGSYCPSAISSMERNLLINNFGL